MNRREFLQSLLALGGGIALPREAIGSAPESVIDQVWQKALAEPLTFYVNEYGALSTAAVETFAESRAELLGFEEIGDRKSLIAFADVEWQVADLLEQEMADDQIFDEDGEEIVRDDWKAWVRSADDGTVARLVDLVNEWINDMPGEQDWERADLCGHSDRGAAMDFFRYQFEDRDMFDIVIVEGDCPGSSYFAAELRMDIDEANALAVEYGLPIRFAAQE